MGGWELTLLTETFYGNPLWRWLTGLVAVVISYAALRLLKYLVATRLAQLAKRTATDIDDFAAELLEQRTKTLFLVVLAVSAGAMVVILPPSTARMARAVVLIALSVQGALWASGAISYWISRAAKQRAAQDPDSLSAYGAISFLARVVLWLLVGLLILRNLGIDITALVAGLGVGGIAVALAVQNILGDLFASMSIVLDKPFVIGDFIIVDNYLGTVEYIGLKTTRIRSLSGEQIVFSNTDLLGSRVRNYKRMYERRVLFSLGVTYQTPYEKLAAIPAMIRETIESLEDTRFDRAHFQKYGDFALIYEIVYYVRLPDYNVYMDRQQAINLAIFKRFTEEGIEFAYPTQTLYLFNSSTSAPAAPEAGQTGAGV